MDTMTAEHYLVRAHVWPSMKNELPHHVVVVLSVDSGAVIHRVSSFGGCSHVVAVLFIVLDHVQKHGSVASKPCTSQECSWNKGKKRNKNPWRISDANYGSKLRKAATPVIDFDPRPVKCHLVTPDHIRRFVVNLQCLSQNGNGNISMWETQLKITYHDYDLTRDQSELLSEKVTVLLENIKPEVCSEVEGTQEQSLCDKWFSSHPSDGIPFYEDVTLNENGDAHLSWHCAGTRVSSPRTMLDLKTFVIFSVDLLSRGGLLTIPHIPQSIFQYGNILKLFGATLWNGGHYICMFCFRNGWYLYDGLKEYRREGSGISFSPTIFNDPLGYTLSYLVYCV